MEKRESMPYLSSKIIVYKGATKIRTITTRLEKKKQRKQVLILQANFFS